MLTNDPRIGLWPFASSAAVARKLSDRSNVARFSEFSQLLRHRAPRHVGECCCQHPSHRAKFHHEASAAQLTCASERCQTRKPQSPKLTQKTRQSNKYCVCVCANCPHSAIYFTILACSWQAVTNFLKNNIWNLEKSVLNYNYGVFGCVPASKILQALFCTLRISGSLGNKKWRPKLCHQKQI